MAEIARKRRAGVGRPRDGARVRTGAVRRSTSLAPESLDAYVRWGFLDRPDGQVELACPPETEAAIFEVASERARRRRGVGATSPSCSARATVLHGDRSYLPSRGSRPRPSGSARALVEVAGRPLLPAGGHRPRRGPGPRTSPLDHPARSRHVSPPHTGFERAKNVGVRSRRRRGRRVVGLAGRAARNLVDDDDSAAAPCSRRGALADQPRSSSTSTVVPGRRRDDRDHDLAPLARPRPPTTSAVVDGGVLLQRLLDLLGPDLLAAGRDAARAASEERDGAVGVDGWPSRRAPRSGRPSISRNTRADALGVLVVADGDVARRREQARLARDPAGCRRPSSPTSAASGPRRKRDVVATIVAGPGLGDREADALARAERVVEHHVAAGAERRLHRRAPHRTRRQDAASPTTGRTASPAPRPRRARRPCGRAIGSPTIVRLVTRSRSTAAPQLVRVEPP